jgi:hypothetical protein
MAYWMVPPLARCCSRRGKTRDYADEEVIMSCGIVNGVHQRKQLKS